MTGEVRAQAATTTALGAAACTAVAPFYWEIGDTSGTRVSGSVTTVGGRAYRGDTSMAIASASKWLYSAYVVERRSGVLTAADIRFLNFRSGYTSFLSCSRGQTVDACLASPAANGAYTAADDGFFFYGGGHMQQHASLLGLGALDSATLAAEMQSRLGADVGLSYNQPQLAGGAQSTASDYAGFLRKLLVGAPAGLKLGPLLGTQAVCTNPSTCTTARTTPIPSTESWHYALGHWVEDDPVVGDGAFSSTGAFGFYPWVDSSRTLYGVLAREAASGAGVASAYCGRLIRKAWVTGRPQ